MNMNVLALATTAAATGDDANILLYVVLAVVAIGMVVGLALKDKFTKSDKMDDEE